MRITTLKEIEAMNQCNVLKLIGDDPKLEDMIRSIFGAFMALPICSVVFIIFSYRLIKTIRKRTKIQS
ncbi:MAG: hypothetical protein GPJ51_14795 [Candidatus Heimdallarchaeota archaeon]|nr:hypothetical protein [Candidatus Heimdallarchaeota archaeon]